MAARTGSGQLVGPGICKKCRPGAYGITASHELFKFSATKQGGMRLPIWGI
jgi:hypothetical protein